MQTVELWWSRGLDRGAAQREGDGTPAAVEWQPLYPERAPGSNPTSLPEIKHFHGLARVEVPGLALACRPANTSTLSAPATSVIVAPGGAYKFVSVPGKLEADSVPMSHNAVDPTYPKTPPHKPMLVHWNHRCYSGFVPREMWQPSCSSIACRSLAHRRRPRSAPLAGCRGERRH